MEQGVLLHVVEYLSLWEYTTTFGGGGGGGGRGLDHAVCLFVKELSSTRVFADGTSFQHKSSTIMLIRICFTTDTAHQDRLIDR